MRWDAKKDATQSAIIKALREIGVTVVVTNSPGLPDLLTHTQGRWLPVEVKSPGGKLTALQQDLYCQARFPIIESVAEALALFGVT